MEYSGLLRQYFFIILSSPLTRQMPLTCKKSWQPRWSPGIILFQANTQSKLMTFSRLTSQFVSTYLSFLYRFGFRSIAVSYRQYLLPRRKAVAQMSGLCLSRFKISSSVITSTIRGRWITIRLFISISPLIRLFFPPHDKTTKTRIFCRLYLFVFLHRKRCIKISVKPADNYYLEMIYPNDLFNFSQPAFEIHSTSPFAAFCKIRCRARSRPALIASAIPS